MAAATKAKSTNKQPAGGLGLERADRELEKLQKELKKQQEIKDALERSTAEMTQMARALEKDIQSLTEENLWKERYEQQSALNKRLETQLAESRVQLSEIKRKNQRGQKRNSSDEMSEVELRLRLQQLEKEKTYLQWQIHSQEWKLNKESQEVHATESEKKEIMTKLSEATVKLAEKQKRLKNSQCPYPLQQAGVLSPQPSAARKAPHPAKSMVPLSSQYPSLLASSPNPSEVSLARINPFHH